MKAKTRMRMTRGPPPQTRPSADSLHSASSRQHPHPGTTQHPNAQPPGTCSYRGSKTAIKRHTLLIRKQDEPHKCIVNSELQKPDPKTTPWRVPLRQVQPPSGGRGQRSDCPGELLGARKGAIADVGAGRVGTRKGHRVTVCSRP